jgi:hypothetical protein
MMYAYKSLAEEAADLEAVIAERFPELSDEDRNQFCAAVLYKVADLYRCGADSYRYSEEVILVSHGDDARVVGKRALLIHNKEA